MTPWTIRWAFVFFSLGCSSMGANFLAGLGLGVYLGLSYAEWWIREQEEPNHDTTKDS